MKLLAKVISYVFHPLLIPTYTFLLIFAFNPGILLYLEKDQTIGIFLKVFCNTFLFPAVIIFLMWKLDFVDSIYLRTKRERIMPYIGVSIFFAWSVITFKNLALPSILYQILLGATLAIFIAFIVNIFLKISMHTIGMGCLMISTIFLAYVSNYDLKFLVMGIMLLAGVVGTGRLILKDHTPREVYIGYCVGIISQLIAFRF